MFLLLRYFNFVLASAVERNTNPKEFEKQMPSMITSDALGVLLGLFPEVPGRSWTVLGALGRMGSVLQMLVDVLGFEPC